MKYIKFLKQISAIAIIGLLMASCGKDIETTTTNPGEITPTTETEQNSLLTRSTTNSTETGLSFDCFEVQYTFSLLDDEGVEHPVDSDEAFLALIESGVELIDLVYPVTITMEDGTTAEINDGEELGEAFANCLPNEWTEDLFPAYLINSENSCFELVYPVNLQDGEGNTSSVENEDEFIEAIAEELLFFVFPLTITADGEEISVGDIDELFEALVACNGYEIDDSTYTDYNFDYIGCYEINFPFDVVLADGTTVTVNDHMEYCDLLLQGDIVDFAYPLTLTDEDGEEIVINSAEELEEVLAECWGDGGFGEFNPDAQLLLIGTTPDSIGTVCYTINYPLSVNQLDFQTGEVIEEIEVGSDEEFIALEGLMDGTLFYSISYPVSVTLNETGETVELNGIEDLFELLSECFGG